MEPQTVATKDAACALLATPTAEEKVRVPHRDSYVEQLVNGKQRTDKATAGQLIAVSTGTDPCQTSVAGNPGDNLAHDHEYALQDGTSSYSTPEGYHPYLRYPAAQPGPLPQQQPFFLGARVYHPPTSISALLTLSPLKEQANGENLADVYGHLANGTATPAVEQTLQQSYYQYTGALPVMRPEYTPYPPSVPIPPQYHPQLYQHAYQVPTAMYTPQLYPMQQHEQHQHQAPGYQPKLMTLDGRQYYAQFQPQSAHPQALGHVNQLLSQELSTLVQSEIDNLNRRSSTGGPSSLRQADKARRDKRRVSAERAGRRSSTAGLNSREALRSETEDADTGAGAGIGEAGEAGGTTGRGGKVYVLKACVACKTSHVACDVNRPCGRCVRLGKPEQCVDAERKKRGRPATQSQYPAATASSSPSAGHYLSARPTGGSSSGAEEIAGRSESEEPMRDHKTERRLSEQVELRQHEAGGYLAPNSPFSSTPPAAPAITEDPFLEGRGRDVQEDHPPAVKNEPAYP